PSPSLHVLASPLATGTSPVRASVWHLANNQGSASQTITYTPSPSTYAVSGQERVLDPDTLRVPFGRASIDPNTGDLEVMHPLDFDVSPGAGLGSTPFLAYHSSTIAVRPILAAPLASDPIGAGWYLSGLDRLIPYPGGVLWVYGAGGSRLFHGAGDGSFTSPANDFGSLTQQGDGSYVYRAKDQTEVDFGSDGWIGRRVD